MNDGTRSDPKKPPLGITSDGHTLRRARPIMNNSEHRRSAAKDLQTVPPGTMLPTEKRCRGVAIMPILQTKAFPRRQLPMLHASATPPRREETPAGALAAGSTNTRKDFRLYRRTSPHLQGLGQQRPCSLTPPPPQHPAIEAAQPWYTDNTHSSEKRGPNLHHQPRPAASHHHGEGHDTSRWLSPASGDIHATQRPPPASSART